MTDLVLNILSLGTKPLYEKQMRFHYIITEFRSKLSRIEEGSLMIADIDEIYTDLDNFDFSFVLFTEYYQKYIGNLNRFKPNTEDENPDVTFLLIAIAEDPWKPTDLFGVFMYHIRYKYKLTSRFFIARQKKHNLKKLNTPEVTIKEESKFNSSKKWTRIPLRQDQCKPGCGCSK